MIRRQGKEVSGARRIREIARERHLSCAGITVFDWRDEVMAEHVMERLPRKNQMKLCIRMQPVLASSEGRLGRSWS